MTYRRRRGSILIRNRGSAYIVYIFFSLFDIEKNLGYLRSNIIYLQYSFIGLCKCLFYKLFLFFWNRKLRLYTRKLSNHLSARWSENSGQPSNMDKITL